MPDWSRYGTVPGLSTRHRGGLQSTQPSPTSALLYSVAQDGAGLHLVRWQPSEAQLSVVSISANPFECSRSSNVSLPFSRIGTCSSRCAGSLPESQHRIALGGLQRCPGSFLREKGFASSIPGENLTSHLDAHRPRTFSPQEWLHLCGTGCMVYKAFRTKSL